MCIRDRSTGTVQSEANILFLQGLELYRTGNVNEALSCWRKAFELEPDNLLIRKQVWAVQNPEKFYNDNIDYDWQQKRIKENP